MRPASLTLTLLLLAGCRTAPTADEARAMLQGGDAPSALQAARRASAQGPPEERAAARRVAVRAALAAGLVVEAASDYEHLRRDLGGDDPALLVELGLGALKTAQASPDPARRLRAVLANEAILDDPRASAGLRAGVSDLRATVRAAAARLLARSADREAAATTLARLAARDLDAEVRRQALVALAALERPRAEVAAVTVAPITSESGAPDLLALAGERLVDPDEEVRREALAIVGRALLAGPRARAAWAHERLVEALGKGTDAERLVAAGCLLAADPADARAAWTAVARRGLLPEAPDRAPATTLEAFAAGLEAHAPQGRLAPVRAALARGAPYLLRLAATRALAGPGAARVEAELTAALQGDPAQPVRVAALEALLCAGGEAPETRAAAVLHAGLEHADPAVRRASFLRLERGAPLGVDALVAILATGDPALVADASRALAARGGEVGWRALLAATERGQVAALSALAQAGDARLRPWLLKLAAGPEGPVRVEALRGLSRAGAAEDRPALVAILTRPASDGADVAAAAAILAIDRRVGGPPPASEQ